MEERKNILERVVDLFTLRNLIILLGIGSLFMIGLYFFQFHDGLAEDHTKWASFGSYLGSIAGTLAFLIVFYSLVLSEKRTADAKKKTLDAEYEAMLAKKEAKQEVAAAKRESDKRESKATEQAIRREERDLFFKLLELHREKLNSVVYTEGDDKKLIGINAFKQYINISNNILNKYSFDYCFTNLSETDYIDSRDFNPNTIGNKLIDTYRFWEQKLINELNQNKDEQRITTILIQKYSKEHMFDFINESDFSSESNNLYPNIFNHYKVKIDEKGMYEGLKVVGDVLNQKYGHILGQYFANLYYVLETIDKFNYDKFYYFNLYKAQLSRIESLICLFYTIYLAPSPYFVILLARYEILNNIYFKDLFFTSNISDDWEHSENEFIFTMYCVYYKDHLGTDLGDVL